LVNLDLSQRQMNEHLSGDTAMLKQVGGRFILINNRMILENN